MRLTPEDIYQFMYIKNNLFSYPPTAQSMSPRVILFAIHLYTSHRDIQGDIVDISVE